MLGAKMSLMIIEAHVMKTQSQVANPLDPSRNPKSPKP